MATMKITAEHQSRVEFEAWASDNGAWPKAVERAADGCYLLMSSQVGWQTWQGARAMPAGIKPLCHIRPAAALTPARAWQAWENDGTAEPVYTAAQLLAMGRVPPGWQAVPVEPTEEMKRGAQMAAMDHSDHGEWLTYEWQDVLRTWKGLLAAAPRPPAAQEQK